MGTSAQGRGGREEGKAERVATASPLHGNRHTEVVLGAVKATSGVMTAEEEVAARLATARLETARLATARLETATVGVAAAAVAVCWTNSERPVGRGARGR